MERPSKLKSWMDIAETVAQRSHDAETKVGSILIKNSNGAMIASGTNGYVRGAPDSELPNTRPDKYVFILHSEQNLIYNCARLGISMEDCTLICTLSPCVSCMRGLWQSGITSVVVKALYKDFDEILKMKDLKIETETTPEGFIRLTYRAVDGN